MRTPSPAPSTQTTAVAADRVLSPKQPPTPHPKAPGAGRPKLHQATAAPRAPAPRPGVRCSHQRPEQRTTLQDRGALPDVPATLATVASASPPRGTGLQPRAPWPGQGGVSPELQVSSTDGPSTGRPGPRHHQLSARQETGYICNFLKAWSQRSKRGCFSSGNCNVSPEPSHSPRRLLKLVPAQGPPQAGPPPCQGCPAAVPALLTGQEPSLGGGQGCPPRWRVQGQEGAQKPHSQSPTLPPPLCSDPRRCRMVLSQMAWE